MRDAYIFDVEGTLSDFAHRLHLAPKVRSGEENWDAFQEQFKNDPLRDDVASLLMRLSGFGEIFISTGLPEKRRDDLFNWLDYHGLLPYINQIFMRSEEDKAMRTVYLKIGHLRSIGNSGYKVRAIFDDRADVCAVFAEKGITAFNINSGAHI